MDAGGTIAALLAAVLFAGAQTGRGRRWAMYEREMRAVHGRIEGMPPGRPVVELEDGDPILHAVYDLSKGLRVPRLNVSLVYRIGVNDLIYSIAR